MNVHDRLFIETPNASSQVCRESNGPEPASNAVWFASIPPEVNVPSTFSSGRPNFAANVSMTYRSRFNGKRAVTPCRQLRIERGDQGVGGDAHRGWRWIEKSEVTRVRCVHLPFR